MGDFNIPNLVWLISRSSAISSIIPNKGFSTKLLISINFIPQFKNNRFWPDKKTDWCSVLGGMMFGIMYKDTNSLMSFAFKMDSFV